jgi:hypothetical protein
LVSPFPLRQLSNPHYCTCKANVNIIDNEYRGNFRQRLFCSPLRNVLASLDSLGMLSTGLGPGLYTIKQDRGADASMRINDDGTCVVLAGSLFRAREGPSVSPSASALRKELQRLGKLVVDGDALRLTQDTEFTSPSAAAGVVFGRSASGPANWKKRQPTARLQEETPASIV